MYDLKSGCFAYFDSFSGLVPVQVLSVQAPETTPQFDLSHGLARISIKVRARVTQAFGAYKKNEILCSDSVAIVPRKAVRRRKYATVVKCYAVVPDPVAYRSELHVN